MTIINPLLTQETTENTSILQLWHQQVKQHHLEGFRGVGLQKFPQDLWVYKTLIWQVQPSLVIEIGVNNGGFSLWLADRLRSLRAYTTNRHSVSTETPFQPRVVGLDTDITRATRNISFHPDLAPYIHLEMVDTGGSKQIQELAKKHIHDNDKVMIIEDSAHIYETTFTCLKCLSPFISEGSCFIIEDDCVAGLEMFSGLFKIFFRVVQALLRMILVIGTSSPAIRVTFSRGYANGAY
jgi:cephalosporin hydroxylase